MNARLQKEIRPLIFPGALVVVCALLTLAEPSVTRYKHLSPLYQLASFIIGFASIGFFGGIAFLAAISFGVEFQQRTFVLLLSQPMERFRLWRDKMFVLTMVVMAACVLQFAASITINFFARYNFLSIEILILFVIAAICSTTFWTLTARSTIGGVAFSSGIIFGGAGLTRAALFKFFGTLEYKPVLIVVGLVYSAVCLWLGWRKFAGMEMRDTFVGEIVSLPSIFPGAKWLHDLLRPRPLGPALNLIRKELRLQKPVFILAALLSFCWLVALGLFLFLPTQEKRFDITFGVLTALFFLLLVLSGCIAHGEEKTLGVTAWHLTLPPSTFRQWLTKFLVSAGVFLLLGFVLPFLLACLTSLKMKVGLLYLLDGTNGEREWAVFLSFVSIYVLSFWAGSLTGNTVRAALTTVFTYIAFFMLVMLAAWTAEQFDGLQTSLFMNLTKQLGWSPQRFSALWSAGFGIGVTIIVITIIALWQSLRSFRRAQTSEGIPVKQPFLLLAVTFITIFWAIDFERSANVSWRLLGAELSSVVQSSNLKESDFPPPGSRKKINLEQFENANHPIPPRIKSWLENAAIELSRDPFGSSRGLNYALSYMPEFSLSGIGDSFVMFKFGSSADGQFVETIPWISPQKRNQQFQQKEKK